MVHTTAANATPQVHFAFCPSGPHRSRLLWKLDRPRLIRDGGLWALLMGICCWLPAMTALGQEAKSSPEAIRHYSNAVKAHNAKAYELASDEWTGFLKKYPQDPLVPKAKYYLGVCYLQSKELEQAAAQFGALVGDPKFELVDDARFNLGWTQYTLAQAGKKQLFDTASATFASLIKGNPQSDKADQALYFQGECAYALEMREQAAALYGRLVEEYPESGLVCDALYAQGVALEEAKKYPEAGAVYDDFIAKCGDSGLLTEVKMRKAETVLQAGQFAEAATMFEAAAQVEDFPLADHAAYRSAYCLAKLDKFAAAGKAYAELCASFPKSSYVPDAEMGAARSLFKANDKPGAAAWLDKVIARGGKDLTEAAHWRCRLHLDAGEAAAANKLATDTLPKAGDNEYLPYLKVDQADAIYADTARRAEAVKLYEAVAADHPQSPVAAQAMYYAAFGSLDLEQHEEALRQAGQFLAKFPQHDLVNDAKYVRAESLLQLEKYAEAEAAFAELAQVTDHPDHALWTVRRGLTLYLQKKYKETIAAMQAALPKVEGADGKAETHYLIGGSQFYTDQFEPAAASLQASLNAAPQWRQADDTLLLLSRCQAKLGQHAAAIETVQKLLKGFPQSTLVAQAHYRLAEYQYAVGKLAAAITSYDQCLQADNQSAFAPYALYGKGWTRLKSQQLEPAVAPLTTLIDEYPDHVLVADARFARAMSLRQAGKPQEALADLEAYLAKPDLAVDQLCHGLYEQGLAEVALQKYAESVATFQQVLEKKPDYADADNVLYEIGWSQKSLNKEAEAVKAFGELTAKHPKSEYAGEAHYHVGESLYAAGKYAEAEQQYAAAKAKSEDNKDILEKSLFKLGWSMFQQKEYAEAAPQFAAQLAAAPNGRLAGDGAFMQGECLFRAEKHAEAMPLFVKAMTAELSSPTMKVLAQLHAGQCATQLKKWQEGYDLLKSLPTEYPESPYVAEATYERGWAQQNLNKLDEALADYRAAAVKGQGIVAARSRFMAGELLFGKKDYDEATKEFQRVMFFFGEAEDPAIKNWQAKSGYEAARCAEVRIGDEQDPAKKAKLIADAKKYYQYVVDKHPQHALAKEAQKSLTELSKL